MTVCKKNTYTALCVVDWVCDETYPACTPVCYKGMYYIAKVADATGQPNKAENADMWLGAYEALDGGFFKAMAECVECCGEPVEPIPDTFMQVVNNGDGSFSAIDNEGTAIGTWFTDTTIPDTFFPDTFMRVINNGDGSFSAIDNEGNAVGTWFTDTTIDDTDQVIGDFVLVNPNDGDGILVWEAPILDIDGNPTGDTRSFEAPEPTIDTDTFSDTVQNGNTYTTTNADGDVVTWTVEPDTISVEDTRLDHTSCSIDAAGIQTCNIIDVANGDAVIGTTTTDLSSLISPPAVAEDVYVDEDGEPYLDGDVICRNPVSDLRCNQRGLRWTYKDGTQGWASPDIVTVSSFLEANTINVDENTPLGVIAGSEHSANISAVICGSRFPIDNYFTMKQNADGAGDIRVRPQWQIDGGGWQNFTIGGADEFYITEGQVFAGEWMQEDWADTDPQAVGLHTIEVRYVLEANNLSGGAGFTNGQTNFQVQRVQLNCC